jgi:colanic acid/amylovoran biosynthesis glycosyltransferase
MMNFTSCVTFLKLVNIKGARKKISAFVKYSLINSGSPDIIHFAYTGLATEFIDVLNYTPAFTKIIISARGTGEIVKPAIDKLRPLLLASLWPKVDAVHCVSADMVERLEKLGLSPSRAFVNHPSIDIEKFSYVNRGEYLIAPELPVKILSTGRLHYSKGYVYSLPAIKALLEKGYNLEYHILGDGPDKEMLQFITADLQLQNNVFFHGKVSSSEVISLLKEVHIYLLPSIYEGISNAALEAMSVGVPVITTDAGGMAEVVVSGESGYLISRYSIESIVDRIERTIKNYKEAVNLTRAARKVVEDRFNLTNQIDVFEKEYMRCLTR